MKFLNFMGAVAERPKAKIEEIIGNKTEVAPPRVSLCPRVVIVGAGFGGLNAAQKLAGTEVDVLVIDRNNYHGFWPLLYQVATAGLEPESIVYPVRAILRNYNNVNFQMGEVQEIDFENKQVKTDVGPISYDYLILSAGSANNYFGNNALENTTYGLKDVPDAIKIRNQMLAAFEQAQRETDAEKRKTLMTFVVVGGGPTGVELAGAFAELIRHVIRKDYPTLDVSEAQVILVEAMDRILATFPDSLQQKAQRQLKRLGVQLRLNAAVASVSEGKISFKDGSELPAATVIWAAGVRSAQLADVLGVELARGARVKIEPTLNLPGRTDVFVIGDMAYLEGFEGKKQAYPMVAPVAIQQGKRAASNILAQIKANPMQEFHYFDRGSMATIGRRAAIFHAFGVRMTGYPAWVAWLFVHLMSLVGFRNRLIVLTNWAYNYFTYDRGPRLIIKQK